MSGKLNKQLLLITGKQSWKPAQSIAIEVWLGNLWHLIADCSMMHGVYYISFFTPEVSKMYAIWIYIIYRHVYLKILRYYILIKKYWSNKIKISRVTLSVNKHYVAYHNCIFHCTSSSLGRNRLTGTIRSASVTVNTCIQRSAPKLLWKLK